MRDAETSVTTTPDAQHGPGVLTAAEEGAEEIFTIFDQVIRP